MAFARSVARQMGHGLERADVSLHLRKWWKLGYTKQNGMITQSLSPFEQHIISPMFHNAPEKAMRYIKRWATTVVPAGVLCYGTVVWADHDYEARHKEHWD